MSSGLAKGVPVVHVSPEEVYQVITNAASQDPAKVKTSSERLKQLLDMTGAFDALSEISVQQAVPLPVRQQAIIQLKNNLTNHWRSRKILPDQRERIKSRCLSLVNEQDDLICECNEIITAKIARYEYPQQWPNVLPDLVNVVNSNISARYSGTPSNFLQLRRALELLNAILKEGSAQRMLTGVRTMSKIVEQLHPILHSHYSTVAASLSSLSPTSVSSLNTAEDLLLAHLVYKCLAKGAVWMWQKMKTPDERLKVDPWLNDLVQSSVLQLRTLSELRINIVIALLPNDRLIEPNPRQCVTTLYRHVYLIGKFFRRLQQLDAARFVTMPLCSDLVHYYWSKVVQATDSPADFIGDSPLSVFPVRFLVQGMVIFKESIAQWAPVRKDGSYKEQVLPRAFVEEAVKLLVTRFIPLNPADLEGWMADPEEWVNVEESENDHWEYELRPCGERVLMTLASQCGVYVQPLLETTWKEIRGLPASDLTTILQKEALYCAIGRCAIRMKDSIPFEEWLQTNLAPEARDTNPSYPIIKRRIAWLIGKWISSECSSPNNPMVWEVLVHLLRDRGPGTDAVVRLTAAVAIRECIDTLQFDLNVFLPYLQPVVTELLRIMAEADTLESKRRIANCLGLVIERAELHIVPLMTHISGVAAEEDWLLKASLLETLSKLCDSTKEHSAPLCALVVPMVRDSFTPSAKAQLDEDALNLWQTALRQTNTIDAVSGQPGLIELLPLAIDLLSNNLDLLGKIVAILESYFLLDATRILQLGALDVFKGFVHGLKHALSFNQKHMMQALDLLVQFTPPTLYADAIHQSGLLRYIVQAFIDDQAPAVVLTEFVYFLARLAIADKQIFLQLVSATAAAMNLMETQVWEPILNQWWTRFDNMSEPRSRKLVAMGIANLVSTGRPEVLDRLATEICNLWLDVFGEIKEAREKADEDPSSLTLYWDKPAEQLFVDFEGSLEFDRRKAAYENDPVRTTQLVTYVAARLHEAEMACGGPTALQSQWLAKADPTVLKQIQDALAGR
ncbi:unnamed protein product [Somion occarium]|uniref:Importin N-terminal domain-containing protein n=1 Tax=Somion occarium TaxID=3059160 RepID=A0ABP1CY04_9APHY